MSDSNAPVRYGGQALIEGVMIRGPRNLAYALRHPHGHIVVDHLDAPIPSGLWARPFVRGPAMLASQLRLGWKALVSSSQVNVIGSAAPLPWWFMPLIAAIAVAIVLGVFVALPLLITGRGPNGEASLGLRLAEGLGKTALLAAYVVAITRMRRFRRLFSYHGAEHMAVHCHEAGMPLTVRNVSRFSPAHPRCGTAFVVILMVLDTFIMAILPRFGFALDMAMRAALLPVLAGVAYEVLRWSAGRKGLSTTLTHIGIATQRLTTAYPDPDQIEVAIAAISRCQAGEEGVDEDAPWRATALTLPSIPRFATFAEAQAAHRAVLAQRA